MCVHIVQCLTYTCMLYVCCCVCTHIRVYITHGMQIWDMQQSGCKHTYFLCLQCLPYFDIASPLLSICHYYYYYLLLVVAVKSSKYYYIHIHIYTYTTYATYTYIRYVYITAYVVVVVVVYMQL